MDGGQNHKLTEHRCLQIIDCLANIDSWSHPDLIEGLKAGWNVGGERCALRHEQPH